MKEKSLKQAEKGLLLFVFMLVFVLALAEIDPVTGDSWINTTNSIIPNSSWSDNVNITGTLTINSINNNTGNVLCIKTDKTIGTCTNVINILGGCTCA